MARRAEKRTLIFLPVLIVLFAANLLVHLDLLGFAPGLARRGVFLGLHLILLLIVIMGGRVIPFFTERALQGFVIESRTTIEWLSPLSVIAFMLVEFFLPDSRFSGALAALAAFVNCIRLASWYSHRYWQCRCCGCFISAMPGSLPALC